MHLESSHPKLSDRYMRQIELDSLLAIDRAKYSLALSEITSLRCVDSKEESIGDFGRQLWFFESIGVHAKRGESSCFGVLQYSIEYGLLELVEGHVFDCQTERQHFKQFYETGRRTGHWLHPANRWLLAGTAMVGLIWSAYLVSFVWR